MIRKLCSLASVALLLGLAAHTPAQTPTAIGSITIAGSEGYSAGVWDTGVATATINGLSVQVAYGQYSAPAPIAAGLAALISSNCNFPVFAHAVGAVISFYPKTGKVVSSSSFASVSNDPSVFPSPSFPVQEGPNGGLPDTPVITGLSLNQGPPNMGFVITGTGFAADATVRVGGVQATIVGVPTATQITVQVPTGANQTGVVVTVGNASNAVPFPFAVTPPFGCSN